MGCLLLCLLLLLFHFPSFSSFSLHSSYPLCNPHQYSALLQFKNSFHVSITDASDDCGRPYPKTTTWENGTDCCSWMGVTCDSMSGHVTGLDLSCSGLEGMLHPNSTLFRLTHLQRLNLAHNKFYPPKLPPQLGGLVRLTHLNLSNSGFDGHIPSHISHLSKLASLDLSRNDGLGLKEATWERLVQNATLLSEIFLDDTNMYSISLSSLSLVRKQGSSSKLVTLSLVETGIRGPLTGDVLCLPNLQHLYLSLNEIQAVHLPMLNCSPSLTTLDLSWNELNGSIPSSLSTLQHLTHLDLSHNELNGSIPSSLSTLQHLTHLDLSSNELKGSIPSSLSTLQHLTHLDLSWNEFSGSIPSSLSILQHLTHLDLSHNELNGSITSSLSTLQHLTHLDLSSNELSGSIPSPLPSLLSHLDLSWNQLNGQIPNLFDGLTKLQTLSVQNNHLGGHLPSSLFTLTQLSSFDCSFNKLEGPLPNKITGFLALTKLFLNDNLLNGTIPSWCLSLPSLTALYLSNNQFIGQIGAISSYSLSDVRLCGNKLFGNIPESIFDLVNLTSLCLSSFNYDNTVHFAPFSQLQNLKVLSLSGYNSLSLKADIGVNYTFSNLGKLKLLSNNLIDYRSFQGKFPNLEVLEISNSTLEGKVPKWICDMDSLDVLALTNNLLTSVDEFPLHKLLYLDLSSNLMTGDISSFICNATFLHVINLSHNKLTGTFPQCLANFSSLEVLDLQMNNLHGTLPNTFPISLDFFILNLNGNQLEGPLPKSLSNCIRLEELNIGNNQIEDTFPNWLQNLPGLEVLVLRGNKMYGPVSSMKTRQMFGNIIIFDISSNNFSGPLPQVYINQFQAMKTVLQPPQDGSSNYLEVFYMEGIIDLKYDSSVTTTIKGVRTTFVKIPKVFVNIDLSNNKFEGEIPNVMGELQALKALNLSHNRLTGPIPNSMGKLTNLESLDLSSNMLTGGIPFELSNLNSLEVLNLSHNHLVGEIPQGKQFNTFSNDSYDGNIGLCGFPMSKPCNKGPELPIFQMEEKLGFGWKPVAIGYGCGMVVGVGLGCFVLFIGKPRWLVRMVEGNPNKRLTRRRGRRT